MGSEIEKRKEKKESEFAAIAIVQPPKEPPTLEPNPTKAPSPTSLTSTLEAASQPTGVKARTTRTSLQNIINITEGIKEYVKGLSIEVNKAREADQKNANLLFLQESLRISVQLTTNIWLYVKDPKKHEAEIRALFARDDYKAACEQYRLRPITEPFTKTGELTDEAAAHLAYCAIMHESFARGLVWREKLKHHLEGAMKGNENDLREAIKYSIAGLNAIERYIASFDNNIRGYREERTGQLLFKKDSKTQRVLDEIKALHIAAAESMLKVCYALGIRPGAVSEPTLANVDLKSAMENLNSALAADTKARKETDKLFAINIEPYLSAEFKARHPISYTLETYALPFIDVAATAAAFFAGGGIVGVGAKESAERAAAAGVKRLVSAYFASRGLMSSAEAVLATGSLVSADALMGYAMTAAAGCSAISLSLKAGGLSKALSIASTGIGLPLTATMMYDTVSTGFDIYKYGLTASQARALILNLAFMAFTGYDIAKSLKPREIRIKPAKAEVPAPAAAPKPFLSGEAVKENLKQNLDMFQRIIFSQMDVGEKGVMMFELMLEQSVKEHLSTGAPRNAEEILIKAILQSGRLDNDAAVLALNKSIAYDIDRLGVTREELNAAKERVSQAMRQFNNIMLWEPRALFDERYGKRPGLEVLDKVPQELREIVKAKLESDAVERINTLTGNKLRAERNAQLRSDVTVEEVNELPHKMQLKISDTFCHETRNVLGFMLASFDTTVMAAEEHLIIKELTGKVGDLRIALEKAEQRKGMLTPVEIELLKFYSRRAWSLLKHPSASNETVRDLLKRAMSLRELFPEYIWDVENLSKIIEIRNIENEGLSGFLHYNAKGITPEVWWEEVKERGIKRIEIAVDNADLRDYGVFTIDPNNPANRELAIRIGREAAQLGIEITVHAPWVARDTTLGGMKSRPPNPHMDPQLYANTLEFFRNIRAAQLEVNPNAKKINVTLHGERQMINDMGDVKASDVVKSTVEWIKEARKAGIDVSIEPAFMFAEDSHWKVAFANGRAQLPHEVFEIYNALNAAAKEMGIEEIGMTFDTSHTCGQITREEIIKNASFYREFFGTDENGNMNVADRFVKGADGVERIAYDYSDFSRMLKARGIKVNEIHVAPPPNVKDPELMTKGMDKRDTHRGYIYDLYNELRSEYPDAIIIVEAHPADVIYADKVLSTILNDVKVNDIEKDVVVSLLKIRILDSIMNWTPEERATLWKSGVIEAFLHQSMPEEGYTQKNVIEICTSLASYLKNMRSIMRPEIPKGPPHVKEAEGVAARGSVSIAEQGR